MANYITQLKRSGYFQTVEIKESHQDSGNKTVQIFNFVLTTQFGLPQGGSTTQTGGNTAPAGGAGPAQNPAAGGSPAARKTGSV